MKIARVMLYDEPTVPQIEIDKAAEFIAETFKVRTTVRGPIMPMCDPDAIRSIAAARIRDPKSPFQRHVPSNEEVAFEENHASAQDMVLYDGFELQNAYCRAVPQTECADDTFHIIFTDKMTCTYDHSDCRYHGRALVGSNPAIISTTGMVEAPAKPREYYLELLARSGVGASTEPLQEKFRGKFLEYCDPRLGRVAHGYIMQAIFYYETCEAFCKDAGCRLYNAHWQSDLLRAQVETGRLCKMHRDVLERLTMT